MSVERITATNACDDLFANELPWRGMPSDWEINQSLFGRSPAPEPEPLPAPAPRHRVWLSGVVALEPLESPMQGQPFASWPRSRLTYHVGVGDEPPEGYTGVTYRMLKRAPDTEW